MFLIIILLVSAGIVFGVLFTNGNEFKGKENLFVRVTVILLCGLQGLLIWLLFYSLANLGS